MFTKRKWRPASHPRPLKMPQNYGCCASAVSSCNKSKKKRNHCSYLQRGPLAPEASALLLSYSSTCVDDDNGKAACITETVKKAAYIKLVNWHTKHRGRATNARPGPGYGTSTKYSRPDQKKGSDKLPARLAPVQSLAHKTRPRSPLLRASAVSASRTLLQQSCGIGCHGESKSLHTAPKYSTGIAAAAGRFAQLTSQFYQARVASVFECRSPPPANAFCE